MAKILSFTMAAPGHLFPFMPPLIALQERGHQVMAVICDARRSASSLSTVPLVALGWRAGERRDESEGSRTAAEQERADFATFGTPLLEAVHAVLDEHRPDVVLVDPSLWGAMLAAKLHGRPWVSIAHNPLLFRGLGLDVRGPGLRPAHGPFTQLLHRATGEVLRWKVRHRLDVMNAVRRARGLSALRRLSDMYHEPTLVLATTTVPFEYPRADWPSNLQFVGPMPWEPPMDPDWKLDIPADRDVVLLVGSSIRDMARIPPWPTIVLKALRNERYAVLATLPTGDLPETPPPNAFVSRSLPHGAILRRASCVVCHGGPGIAAKALCLGVPVVSIPYAYDRFEVARRIELSGAGMTLPINRLSPRRIQNALRRATGEPMRSAAAGLAALFATAGGASAAATEIERLL